MHCNRPWPMGNTSYRTLRHELCAVLSSVAAANLHVRSQHSESPQAAPQLQPRTKQETHTRPCTVHSHQFTRQYHSTPIACHKHSGNSLAQRCPRVNGAMHDAVTGRQPLTQAVREGCVRKRKGCSACSQLDTTPPTDKETDPARAATSASRHSAAAPALAQLIAGNRCSMQQPRA